ncbi:tRNA (adenine(58)-N(1))-methyltransferase non-catalytic subunit TRM6 [Simiduia sp. 21SJ11W-1]|uniref:tRNA (adenine(58)-N(1))-methyltransferase non-catalytic subunit TRM6 n=1 Tax=Simiduia sp. 21SJ11W-1 TaxID=2909669 RepID=UPI00209F83DD|nr:tRNA (adenine(58)-N(1))-methyltransferase non-catalytic subunit TRM6 [Simiduia sp. 21SJ11W-1]UTA47863.1 tRNA (adenine(58)-N(1))-methyltransferase non-catalytic subunit TRM6 [Simiduia sp. 21SJ11W-1]
MEQQAAVTRAAVRAGEAPTQIRSRSIQPRRAAQVKKINPYAKDPVTGCLNYMALRPQLLDGDIILFRAQGLQAKWRRLKEGDADHLGLVGRWGARVMVFEDTACGVIARPLSARLEAYTGQVELYKPNPVNKMSAHQRELASTELLARMGNKLSWRQWFEPEACGVSLAEAVYTRAALPLTPPAPELGQSVAQCLVQAPQLVRVGRLK